MAWWDDVQKAVTTAGGGTTGGAPPPPSVSGGGSSGTTYQQYTAPAGPQGGALPAGTVYTVGSNGSFSIDYRPSTSGGSGSVSVSLNPNSTAAWGRATDQAGNIWMVNELDPSQNYILFPASNGGRDPSGYDPATGLPYGVTRVNTDISPTGLVYQGKPVNPDGSLYQAGAQPANYTGLREGSGGVYGLNTTTGKYELIPGSAPLGSAASNQPATYSGGGGGSSGASAYSSIATAQINAQSRLAAIEAESAARTQAAQQEADLQKSLIQLQQQFTAEQNRISNALAAAGQASQIAVANAQLRQQYEAQKVALIGEYRESLKDYDARAVWDAIRGTGALQNAVGQGQSLLTDNANAGAAALLGALERPFEPIPAYDPNLFGSGIGGPMGGGLPGGAATGGVTSGTGGTTGTGATGGSGGATGGIPFSVPNVDSAPIADQLRAAGVPESEIAAALQEIALGQKTAQDYAMSQYYKSLTGSGLYLRGDNTMGGTVSGGAHELQGNYSGVWQTVDPYAPNYKSPNDPMFLPSWQQQPTSVSGMAGAGGNFVPPTEPIPTNHPLAGGLTGGVVKPPDTVIPMLAGGGMVKGPAITGDPKPGSDEPNPELTVWTPHGNIIEPISEREMHSLSRFGMPRFAYGTTLSGGTLSGRRRATYEEPTYTAPVPPPTIPYSEPVQNPIPQPAPVPTQPTPTPVTGTTGGSGTTPSTTTTPLPVPSTAPPPSAAQPPVTPTNPLDSVYTPEQQDLLDRVMEYRTGTADMMLPFGPWDVAFQGLTPFEQNLYYQNEAQKRGIPAELFAQDVARRGLAGVGGGLAGRIGY